MPRLRLETPVGRRPLLQRPQPFDSVVRLAEDPQAEDADHDEQDDRADEGDDQFRADPCRDAADGSNERVVRSAQLLPTRRRRRCASR